MLAEKDKPNSPNIELIDLIARFGFSHQQIVIVEGILSAARYGQMLKALMNTADQSLVYYFDLSFDETLRRHAHRPKAAAFGAEAMHRWFRPHDYLGVPNEHLIQADQSQDTVVSRILADLNKRNSDQARYSDWNLSPLRNFGLKTLYNLLRAKYYCFRLFRTRMMA